MARSKQHLSHKEIMVKRNKKQKKKTVNASKENPNHHMREYLRLTKTRENHLSEYLRLSKKKSSGKKDTARCIMEIVEEINEEGMNDKRYMDIMNQLMFLHKSVDTDITSDIIRPGTPSPRTPSPRTPSPLTLRDPNIDPNMNNHHRHYTRGWRTENIIGHFGAMGWVQNPQFSTLT